MLKKIINLTKLSFSGAKLVILYLEKGRVSGLYFFQPHKLVKKIANQIRFRYNWNNFSFSRRTDHEKRKTDHSFSYYLCNSRGCDHY